MHACVVIAAAVALAAKCAFGCSRSIKALQYYDVCAVCVLFLLLLLLLAIYSLARSLVYSHTTSNALNPVGETKNTRENGQKRKREREKLTLMKAIQSTNIEC